MFRDVFAFLGFKDADGNVIDPMSIPIGEVADWAEEHGMLDNVEIEGFTATGEDFHRLANPTAWRLEHGDGD